MEDEVIVKRSQPYYDGDWAVEIGIDGNVAISFFQDNHYYSEIILNVKDGVKVVRHD